MSQGSSDWRNYPYHSGDLVFPDDEGVHADKPYGWWYLNMHLDDADGNRVILFTSFVSGANEQLGAIADLSRKKHLDQYQTGVVTASQGHLDVQYQHGDSPPNYLRQVEGEPFIYDYHYALSGYQFDLRLTSVKPPYALAQTGLVQQLPATYSYYYVQPRMDVTGTMTRDDGSTSPITGICWLDRQWYPLTNPGTDVYMGHFWAAIHLDDGTDIAAYRCLGQNGASLYPLFEIMGPDLVYRHYPANTIIPLELFTTPPIGEGPIREFKFPRSARILHEPTGTDLLLEIATPNPMDNALALGLKGCFFEGGFSVSGTHNQQSVNGDAYIEVSLFGAQLLDTQTTPESNDDLGDEGILRDATAAFFLDACQPDRVADLLSSGEHFDAELWQQMINQGYLGLLLPDTCSGLGLGLRELVIIAEEMGKAAAPGPFLSTLGASCALKGAIGNPAISDLLSDLVTGSIRVTLATATQPQGPLAGLEPPLLVVNGDTCILHGGQVQALDADDPDQLLVAARDESGESCLVLCPRAAQGLSLTRTAGIDDLQPVFRIGFDNVELETAAIIAIGQTATDSEVQATLITGIAASADRIGSITRVLQNTQNALADMEAVGQTSPFPELPTRVNNLMQRVNTCRSTLLWAASRLQAGIPEADKTATLARMSVMRASIELAGIVNDCHVGMGLTWEEDLNLFRRLPPFFDAIANHPLPPGGPSS